MTDPATQIENMRERIQESEEISNEDRDVLMEFSNTLFLLETEYSDHRHLKLLSHCTNMAEKVGGLADALDDRDAAEELVRWINQTYDNRDEPGLPCRTPSLRTSGH